jgi:hypothetical protein
VENIPSSFMWSLVIQRLSPGLCHMDPLMWKMQCDASNKRGIKLLSFGTASRKK